MVVLVDGETNPHVVADVLDPVGMRVMIHVRLVSHHITEDARFATEVLAARIVLEKVC